MKEVKKIRGVGVTSLKVGARLHFIKKEKSSIGDKDKPSSPERELERFGKAKSRATDQLIDLEERTRKVIGKDEAEIFEIHRMLLDDEDLNQAILEKIDNKIKEYTYSADFLHICSEDFDKSTILASHIQLRKTK